MSESYYEKPPANESHADFCRRWERIWRARAEGMERDGTRAEYLELAKRYARDAAAADRFSK